MLAGSGIGSLLAGGSIGLNTVGGIALLHSSGVGFFVGSNAAGLMSFSICWAWF